MAMTQKFTAEEVRREAAGLKAHGYVAGPAMLNAYAEELRAALAAQGQGDGEPAAWRIHTDDDVERVAKAAGWDNRRYMTPADYAIWCVRMREFVRLAVARPAPPASPAGVPEGYMLVPRELTRPMIEAACNWTTIGQRWAAMLAAAPSAPEGDGGAE